MTHTVDSGGFFTFLVASAHGAARYVHSRQTAVYVHWLFSHLSLRRLETNFIWVRVKWHYELYHRNHCTVQWSIFLTLLLVLTALRTSEWVDGQICHS